MAFTENCGGRMQSRSRRGGAVPPNIPAVMQAIENLHEAAVQRCRANTLEQLGDRIGASFDRREVDARETETQALLKESREQCTTRGPGGNVAISSYPDAADQPLGRHLRDTLENPSLIHETASRLRMELVTAVATDCLGGDLDAAEAILAGNSLERMAMHQMSAAHGADMKAMVLELRTPERTFLTGHAGAGKNFVQDDQSLRISPVALTASSSTAWFQPGLWPPQHYPLPRVQTRRRVSSHSGT